MNITIASPSKPLTPREEAFVIALMTERSGAHAALAAGFSPRGSMNTAAVAAHRLLRRPHVAAAVERACEARRVAIDEVVKAQAREYAARVFGGASSRAAA